MGCGRFAVARLPPAAPDIASHPSPAPSTQHPPPQPQPRHGKEDMWSPQSDFSDDSTLSQTQNVRPIGWLAPTPTSPPISQPRPARHTPHAHGPQRHSAPGTVPLGCSVAVACTLFLETPRAAAAPRHSAAALPPGFPCLVLASRRSIWQGTHPSPRTRWQVVRRSRAVRHSSGCDGRGGEETARAGARRTSARAPAPRARAP